MAFSKKPHKVDLLSISGVKLSELTRKENY